MLRWASFLAVVLALAVTAPVAAQYAQYTSPGDLGRVPQNQSEALEKAVEEARWRVGFLRLDPAFWISDISWYDDPVTGEGDLLANLRVQEAVYRSSSAGKRIELAGFRP